MRNLASMLAASLREKQNPRPLRGNAESGRRAWCRLAQLLHALLSGHGLSWTLSGPRVGACALASNRQALAVPQAPIATDIAKPGDVLLNLAAELAFHHVLVIKQRGQLGQVVLREVASSLVGVDPGPGQAARRGRDRFRKCSAAR